jgi:maleylacetoacetate isomerase
MTADPGNSQELALYSYWRSSAAYRVRIALNLKGLQYKIIPVHLVRDGGEHHGDEFRSINAQGLVPVLIHQGRVITQSLAICEYLDECFHQYPLLPSDSMERSGVRSLALQIACDIHPINNLRVTKYLKRQLGDEFDPRAWMSHWMTEGFTAVEKQLRGRGSGHGEFLSEKAGLFECFLIPQVYNAERFGMDMSVFPAIQRIVEKSRSLPAFMDAAPENQPDAE